MSRYTPEGKVKDVIDKVLSNYNAYKFMPVQSGYGTPGLDYFCCINGKFLAIEAKAPGKELTPRQVQTQRLIQKAGGEVFVMDSTNGEDILKLMAWLDSHAKKHEF